MSNLVEPRKGRSRAGTSKRTRSKGARLAAHGGGRRARRAWNRQGGRPVRFLRLRAAFSILERKPDGHHVVAYDPHDRDAAAPGRRGQRRSARGRETVPTARGRKVVREGEEDLEEVVSTTRRRAINTSHMREGEVDRIQIEVGAVKALEAKHGIVRGATWMVALALLLWWVPILGPAAVGYIGGRKAGGPWRAAAAALIPITVAFGALAVLTTSTAAVPSAVKAAVASGYQGVLGTLPFDFPILGYVLGNLASMMNAGPDALFLVLAFALVGGAVTQMRIQERSVPPITARFPADRLPAVAPETPARAHGRRGSDPDDLIARLTTVLDRAERERRTAARTSAGGGAWAGGEPAGRGFFARLGLARARAPLRYAGGEGTDVDAPALDEASRQVVASFLSTTPPARGDRRARALKAPDVELDVPTTIAFAAPVRASGVEGAAGAHRYRPSRLYHIYGPSVNPVARAKLEKRLRRTHTLHMMRRGARSFAEMMEVTASGEVVPVPEAIDAQKPRSLEPAALTAELHYDALEHLENASFEAAQRPGRPAPAEDELGGLIAHLGEGGEAVVEERGVEDVAFGGGPVFDRRGRQRARIAEDEERAQGLAPMAAAPAAHKKPAPALVRDSVAAVAERTGHAAEVEAPGAKSKIAKSADRADLSPAQKAKVDRWLKRTLASPEIEAEKTRARSNSPGPEPSRPKAKDSAPEDEAHPPADLPQVHGDGTKAAPKRPKPEQAAPAFEITHGSTEVDAEAASSETESSGVRKNRSAAQILREIRLQKKAEKEAEAGEAVAAHARRAKDEADEIERVARAEPPRPMGEVALRAAEGADDKSKQPAPSKRRQRSADLEPVATDGEKLSADLELTLAPIREEPPVLVTEIGDVVRAEAADHAHAPAPPEVAGIAMVGEVEGGVEVSELVSPPDPLPVEATAEAATPPAAEEERGPEDVVLAGPSTDLSHDASAEVELSASDQERIRRRLAEGWNRL